MRTSTVVEAFAPPVNVSHNKSSFTQTPAFGAGVYRCNSATGTLPSQQVEPPSEATSSPDSRSRPPCIWKRSIDLSCILLGIPFVLPLMIAVCIWIRLVSEGPVIFRQERIGLNGRRFTLYKFRSMHLDADSSRHSQHFKHLVKSGGPMVKLDLLCDSQLIPLGCLLRTAGLDELPQLFNVLRGDMSLVGPRPCLPQEYRFFSHSQRLRFQALPGLTGIWQSEGKGISTFNEMNEMDARYVKTASPLLDLAIICRTPLALLRQIRHASQARQSSKVAAQASLDHLGVGPLGGYSTQRLR